jgi:hypothetical protein
MQPPTSLARAAAIALAAALCGARAASANALFDFNGLLPTQNPDQPILDTQLAGMFQKYFPKDANGAVKSDILLVFGQCYGGDFSKLFDNTLNDPTARQGASADTVAFTNTTVLTACGEGRTADFNGWGSGEKPSALDALKPGNAAQDVATAGAGAAGPSEHPTTTGDLTKTIGGAHSTHVVIYAGKPLTNNDDSRPEIKKVRDNFTGQAGTTVDVLAGDGSAAQSGNIPGAKPATFQALDTLLKQIGENVMQDGEQFILYVADHGEERRASYSALVVPGGASQSVSLDTGELQGDALYAASTDSTYGGPTLTIDTQQFLSNPGAFDVTFGSTSLGTLAQASIGTTILPNGGTALEYTLPVPLSALDAASSSAAIGIFDAGSASATFAGVAFDSGAIPQTNIPEPASAALALVSVAALLGCCRARPRSGRGPAHERRPLGHG